MSGRDRLYIAAKAPRGGRAKTRLARGLGDGPAAMLYAAFLRDLAAQFRQASFEVAWYVTPPDAWTEIGPLLGWQAWSPRVLAQGAGDWAERQRQLFAHARERGEARTILIASDSPQVRLEEIERAFHLLHAHHLVVGPVHDGGYYLLGMRGAFQDVVLRGVRMSTGRVLQEMLERANAAGLSVAQVAPTFDVDDASDLADLRQAVAARPDLPATRSALAALGLLDGTVGEPTPLAPFVPAAAA